MEPLLFGCYKNCYSLELICKVVQQPLAGYVVGEKEVLDFIDNRGRGRISLVLEAAAVTDLVLARQEGFVILNEFEDVVRHLVIPSPRHI